jgi:hypothetical protein
MQMNETPTNPYSSLVDQATVRKYQHDDVYTILRAVHHTMVRVLPNECEFRWSSANVAKLNLSTRSSIRVFVLGNCWIPYALLRTYKEPDTWLCLAVTNDAELSTKLKEQLATGTEF